METCLLPLSMELKRSNEDFRKDMNVLLPTRVDWNFDEAFEYVQNKIIVKIKNEVKHEAMASLAY